MPILVDLEGANLGGPISEGGKFEDGSKVPILVDLEGVNLGGPYLWVSRGQDMPWDVCSRRFASGYVSGYGGDCRG